MSENLNKYLSDVFRRDNKSITDSDSLEKRDHNTAHLTDLDRQQFILDRKFSLRLDEII
jgi:hypothetical protein